MAVTKKKTRQSFKKNITASSFADRLNAPSAKAVKRIDALQQNPLHLALHGKKRQTTAAKNLSSNGLKIVDDRISQADTQNGKKEVAQFPKFTKAQRAASRNDAQRSAIANRRSNAPGRSSVANEQTQASNGSGSSSGFAERKDVNDLYASSLRPGSLQIRGAALPPILLLRNLAQGTTVADLRTVVGQIAAVKDVRVKNEQNLTVTCEIEFMDPNSTHVAQATFNGSHADGRILHASIVKSHQIAKSDTYRPQRKR